MHRPLLKILLQERKATQEYKYLSRHCYHLLSESGSVAFYLTSHNFHAKEYQQIYKNKYNYQSL